jgi:hypothetical protein
MSHQTRSRGDAVAAAWQVITSSGKTETAFINRRRRLLQARLRTARRDAITREISPVVIGADQWLSLGDVAAGIVGKLAARHPGGRP